MDESQLKALAVEGLRDQRHLEDIAAWCWDQADNTGDSRFCGLARTLDLIVSRWDEKGAISGAAFDEVSRLLARDLDAILDAESPEEGAGLARLLREEVGRSL